MSIILIDQDNLGSHISFSKTLSKSIDDAIEMGMYSFQFFLGATKGFKPRARLTIEDVKKSLSLQSRFPMNINSHLPYMYNLCGSIKNDRLAWAGDKKEDIHQLSIIKEIEYELKTLAQFNNKNGKAACVLHLGCWGGGFRVGKGKKLGKVTGIDKGLEAAVKGLNKINYPTDSMLLLENMTSGTKLCKNIDEMSKIWDLVDSKKKENIGFCIDTAHIHGEGKYDLGLVDDIDRLFIDFDKKIGLENLKLIHLNDSSVKLGAEKDQHQLIGQGFVWGPDDTFGMTVHSKNNRILALKYLMDQTKSIPTVLETSPSDYKILQILKGI